LDTPLPCVAYIHLTDPHDAHRVLARRGCLSHNPACGAQDWLIAVLAERLSFSARDVPGCRPV
jgi:hypothetical protein